MYLFNFFLTLSISISLFCGRYVHLFFFWLFIGVPKQRISIYLLHEAEKIFEANNQNKTNILCHFCVLSLWGNCFFFTSLFFTQCLQLIVIAFVSVIWNAWTLFHVERTFSRAAIGQIHFERFSKEEKLKSNRKKRKEEKKKTISTTIETARNGDDNHAHTMNRGEEL